MPLRPSGAPRALTGGRPESMCPSGTNINDAMLRAVQLLESATRAELLSSGSVSLIILLTDGDPTSGERAPAAPEPAAFGSSCDPAWLAAGPGAGAAAGRSSRSGVAEVSITCHCFLTHFATPGSRGDQPHEDPEERAGSHKWPVQPLLPGLRLRCQLRLPGEARPGKRRPGSAHL